MDASSKILKQRYAVMRIIEAMINEIRDSSDLHRDEGFIKESLLLSIQASHYTKLKARLQDAYTNIVEDPSLGVKLFICILNLRRRAYIEKETVPSLIDQQFGVIWAAKASRMDGMHHIPWLTNHNELYRKSDDDNDIDTNKNTNTITNYNDHDDVNGRLIYYKKQAAREKSTRKRVVRQLNAIKKREKANKKRRRSPRRSPKRNYFTHYNDYGDESESDYDDYEDKYVTPPPKRAKRNQPPKRGRKTETKSMYEHLRAEDIKKPSGYDKRNGQLYGNVLWPKSISCRFFQKESCKQKDHLDCVYHHMCHECGKIDQHPTKRCPNKRRQRR